MKFAKIITGLTISVLGYLSFSAFADEQPLTGYTVANFSQFTWGAPIQELRERSTKMFELLDQNQSGSITLDEIDLTQMESDIEDMNPEEIRQIRRRNHAIHSKFMNWSIEIAEFEVVDSNNDGVWTKDEFDVRYEHLQRHRLELGLQEWDADGNDAVELHEFNSHLDELELLDENADGIVSHQEAYKSQSENVISDVLLNKLKLDGSIWAGVEAVVADMEAEAAEVKFQVIQQKKADAFDK